MRRCIPCGEPVPNASNLNFAAGQTVPNAVVAKVGAGGKVCVFAEVPFDLLVDVNGYVPAGSSVGSLSPARLLDSRAGGATVDGQLAGIGQRPTGSITEVPVAGRGGVPADASAVVLNVTVVQAACRWVRVGVPVRGAGAECVEPELRGGPDGAECGGGQGGCGRQGVCVRRGAVRSVGRRERVCAGGFGGRVVEPGAACSIPAPVAQPSTVNWPVSASAAPVRSPRFRLPDVGVCPPAPPPSC